MLGRLLDRVYSPVDVDARPLLAFRLQATGGLHWQIRGRTLTMSTESGAPIGNVSLSGVTMTNLAASVAALGVSVVYSNPDIGHRAADSLLEGEGFQSQSNGDHLFSYDSLLWSIFDACAVELEIANSGAVVGGVAQAYLDTSNGEWLDYWGGYFGLPRSSAEPDVNYLVRLVREVVRLRSTVGAIANACADNGPVHVRVREPWREIVQLDITALDDDYHFYDANFWTPNVFQLQWLDYVPLAYCIAATKQAERNRPVGSLSVHAGEAPAGKDMDGRYIGDEGTIDQSGTLVVEMDVAENASFSWALDLWKAESWVTQEQQRWWDSSLWGDMPDWGAALLWTMAVSLV